MYVFAEMFGSEIEIEIEIEINYNTVSKRVVLWARPCGGL